MAKRKAIARTRKAARKTKKIASRKGAKSVRKTASRRAARPRARAAARRTSRSARKPAAPKRRSRAGGRASRPQTAKGTANRPKPAALQRERRRLRDDETVAGAPSTLGYEQRASGAESGQAKYHHRVREHTEGGAALTGGEIDADWSEAYASGEGTPGGDMPTPDQDVVEEIGRALGVEYEDAEELKGAEKIEERDKHRWEYDPASAEDYKDRNRKD